MADQAAEQPIGASVSDTPAVKIEKAHDARTQNIALGLLLTVAFVLDNCVGSKTFTVWLYLGSMGAGFGVVNFVPQLLGKAPGTVGGLTLLASVPKLLSALAVSRHMITLIYIGTLLTGCAGQLEQVRGPLNESANDLAIMGAGIHEGCKPVPEPDWCAETQGAWLNAVKAHEAAQDLLDGVESVQP